MNTIPVELVLCKDYLWTGETLSIPLSSIIDTGLSKHGGYIRFWDEVSGNELTFNFTKLGFLRFKQKRVAAFLDILNEYLPSREDRTSDRRVEAIKQATALKCEECGRDDCAAYQFVVFRFIGIAPIVYVYKLTPYRFVLCPTHARGQAFECSMRTASAGYLGFPGFLAAPWYVVKNLLALRRQGTCDSRTSLWCLLMGVGVPYAVIGLIIFLLAR